jgi:hypothetical protein
MIRRADVPIQLASGGFLMTALVLDWLSTQVLRSARVTLGVLLPLLLPCLLGLLGVLLTSRVVSRSKRRVVVTAVGAGGLLGALAAAGLFVLVRLPSVRLDDALAHGAGIGVVFGVFAVGLWLRAGQAHTGGRRAGWAVIALLLAAPQPLIALASKRFPHRASFDLSAALGLLACAALVLLAIADVDTLLAAKRRLVALDEVSTSEAANETSEAAVARAQKDTAISVALAAIGCCLVTVARAVGAVSYQLTR